MSDVNLFHSRRAALRMGGLSAAALALAACGVEGRGDKRPVTRNDVRQYWSGKARTGRLDWASWPGYMEDDRSTLKAFTRATGIQVTYKEAIQENATWFGKIQAPLAANQPIGFDLMIMTNGIQLEQCRRLGYLAPLDHSRLPNVAANAGKNFKSPPYDPGNAVTVPYFSGVTGIVYNANHVREPVTGIRDLWNPKYKGKVGMLSDPQELGNFAMLLNGIDPEKSTPADWERAARSLREQRDGGIVRKYYEQNYIDAVSRGDVWLTMGWSGDVYSLAGGADVRFVVPREGGTIWTDNLCIPQTAAHPVDALMMIDWLYDPRNYAPLTEFVNYIPPIPAVRDIVARDAEAATGKERRDLRRLSASPLVFPSESDLSRLRRFRTLAPSEVQEYQRVFRPIAQGG